MQRVALRLDPVMVDVAERFAAELMDRPDDNNKKREGNRRLAINDIAEARALGCKPFWLTYNCDWRGRVYGIPHFNYMRQDHVRAMFRFENGMALGKICCGGLKSIARTVPGKTKSGLKTGVNGSAIIGKRLRRSPPIPSPLRSSGTTRMSPFVMSRRAEN